MMHQETGHLFLHVHRLTGSAVPFCLLSGSISWLPLPLLDPCFFIPRLGGTWLPCLSRVFHAQLEDWPFLAWELFLSSWPRLDFLGGSVVKNQLANGRRRRRCGFSPCVWKIPWRRNWQPTPVFLPGESHGWKSLEGYNPRGHKEADTPERLSTHSQGESSCIWSQKGNVGTEKALVIMEF